jgi:hypothetical protein
MTRKPTFELLREQRELPVVNPANGVRFTISLRDWQGTLWAVRVIPAEPSPTDKVNPFVRQHCLLARSDIKEWLDRLCLARCQPHEASARESSRSS